MRNRNGREHDTPSGLSKESGSVYTGTASMVHLTAVEAMPQVPFWTHAVLRANYGATQWFEHKNYSFCALEIPLEGNLRVVQRDVATIVSPGSVYIIHRGEDSFMESGPAGFCRKVALLLTGSLLSNLLTATGLSERLMVKIPDSEALLRTVAEIERLLAGKDERAIPTLCGLTVNVLMALAQELELERPALLAKALDLMEANLARPVPVRRLAAELSVSPSTLDRLFRRHLANSPKGHYRALRLQRAAELLTMTMSPVKLVAAETGFKNPTYFTAEFRREYGRSPRDFRRDAECAKTLSL